MTRTEEYIVKQNAQRAQELILRSIRIAESNHLRSPVIADKLRLDHLRKALVELNMLVQELPNV